MTAASFLDDLINRSGLSLGELARRAGYEERTLRRVISGEVDLSERMRKNLLRACDDGASPKLDEEPAIYGSPGLHHAAWKTVVRVLADRLNSTQIAESLSEVLSKHDLDETVRNAAAAILSEALLPKLKR